MKNIKKEAAKEIARIGNILGMCEPFDEPENETWSCIECGWEIIDNEGECGIDGICEEADGVFSDTPCPHCGGRLKREGSNEKS